MGSRKLKGKCTDLGACVKAVGEAVGCSKIIGKKH